METGARRFAFFCIRGSAGARPISTAHRGWNGGFPPGGVGKGRNHENPGSEKARHPRKLQNGLIVSCQVQWDDPIYTDDMVVKMAEGARWAGAVGIRANSPEQIRAIKEKVDLPMIGLYKIWHDDTDVFITPTLEAAREVWEAGAEIIALDCTDQITHEGRPAWELLSIVKKEIPGR